jgi:hypothetical protein
MIKVFQKFLPKVGASGREKMEDLLITMGRESIKLEKLQV